MNRAERRRREREARKHPQTVTLQNPVRNHFPAFIFGNSTKCDRVVEKGDAKGKHLILCGAGPSLAEEAGEWCPQGDEVWGCNSALTYLVDCGHRATHGFTVDQTAHMLAEWESAPDVQYMLASTAHPHLAEYLLDKGREIRWFHNFVGIQAPPVSYAVCLGCGTVCDTAAEKCPACSCIDIDARKMEYEDWMYSALYPPTVRSGSGLNSVTRAIDVALYRGFERITVLGADCALRTSAPAPDAPHGSPEHLKWLRESVVMHADGGNALASEASPLTLGGEIDGRHWETKADMVISAVWLVKMQQFYGEDRIQLIGDTLPNALKGKSEEFLARMPTMVDSDGRAVDFALAALD